MEEMTRLFGLDFQLLHDVVLMALAVFFLFLFMSKMLFEPARKLLNDRKNRIAADIKTAETDKQDPKTAAQLSDSPETDIQTPKTSL